MTETLMALVGDWGPAALFVILAINCFGVPFPASLVMLAVGSLVEQGELALGPVLGFGLAGAVVGDQAGYVLGRWGGPETVDRLARRMGAGEAAGKAEALVHRWGAWSVFLSRWALSPLGPYVNVASGLAAYPWRRFLVWGMLGEAVWVAGYVGLGHVFSTSVQQIADILGDLTWFLVGLLATAVLGYFLARSRHAPRTRHS